jgi:hypothetical protein
MIIIIQRTVKKRNLPTVFFKNLPSRPRKLGKGKNLWSVLPLPFFSEEWLLPAQLVLLVNPP